MTSNQKLIVSRIKGLGLKDLGNYDKRLDKLNNQDLSKVLENIQWADTDVEVNIQNQNCVVEIVNCNNEIDFYILTKTEYQNRYSLQEGHHE